MAEFKNNLYVDEDEMKSRFLTFHIDEEMFGIELRNVLEIVGIQPITAMPEMLDYVKGIINLRGKIFPVLDVRLLFKKEEKNYTDRTCIIVIDLHGRSIGLIVDGVSEVITISDKQISEKPEISSRSGRGVVKNIGKINEKVVMLLDCDKLLNKEELEEISDQL